MRLTPAIALFLLVITLPGKSQVTAFQEKFGPPPTYTSGYWWASDVAALPGGELMITGTKAGTGLGFQDVFLLKLDSAGAVLSANAYGGSNDEIAFALLQAADSGFFFCGQTQRVSYPNNNFFLTKTNAAGNISWSKVLQSSAASYAATMATDVDGSILVAGSQYSSSGNYDLVFYKLDTAGNTIFGKKINVFANDRVGHVLPCPAGGYYLSGTSNYSTLFLLRLDASGNLTWAKEFPNTTSGGHLYPASNGGCLVSGTYFQPSGLHDVFLAKLDTTGAVVWGTIYDSGSEDYGGFLTPSEGGNILFGTIQRDLSGNSYIQQIKTDTAGNVLWAKLSGDVQSFSRQAHMPGGGAVFVGDNGVFVMRTDSFGNSGCNQSTIPITVTAGVTDTFKSAVVTTAPALSALNFSMTAVTMPDTSYCFITGETSVPKSETGSLVLYPDPASEQVTLQLSGKSGQAEIKLVDLLGRTLLLRETEVDANGVTKLGLQGIANGYYIVEVTCGDFHATRMLAVHE